MRKAASQRIVGAVALTVLSFFSIVQMAYAWSTTQKAEAMCNASNYAVIKVTFTNTEGKNSNLGMKVIAQDNVSGKSVDLGTVQPQNTAVGYIDVGNRTTSNGTVTFKLTWSNGQSGVDSRTASYSSVTCVQPSATPTATPRVTASPTPVVTPTATPHVTASPTPVVTATPSSTPVVTATPMPTSTPTVTQAPTATPVATEAPSSTPTSTTPPASGGDGRSDGRTESLGCQRPEDNCNPARGGVVLGAQTLPTTGGFSDINMAVVSIVSMAGLVGAHFLKLAKVWEEEVRG